MCGSCVNWEFSRDSYQRTLGDQVVLNILGYEGLAEIEKKNLRHSQLDDPGQGRKPGLLGSSPIEKSGTQDFPRASPNGAQWTRWVRIMSSEYHPSDCPA